MATWVKLTNLRGPVGPSGGPIPSGGTTGQVLTKASATDGDTAWENPTGGSGGTVTSADITDATSIGKTVLTAASASVARTAIGAGTSSLALGSTSTTAMPGNTAIPAAQVQTDWNATSGMGQLLNNPFNLATPADGDVVQYDQNSGMFISDPLVFGHVAGTIALAQMVPGAVFRVLWSTTVNGGSGGWTYAGTYITTRPTARTDVFMEAVDFTGGSGGTPPGFAVIGDTYEVKTT